jgi:hypothetical protein
VFKSPDPETSSSTRTPALTRDSRELFFNHLQLSLSCNSNTSKKLSSSSSSSSSSSRSHSISAAIMKSVIFAAVSLLAASAAAAECAAENVVQACLEMQQTYLDGCNTSDWNCKCQAYQNIVT